MNEPPPPRRHPAPPPAAGRVILGVMLNVALNAFICTVWIPLCSVDQKAEGLVGDLGVVFFFGMYFIGLTQWIHVIPLLVILSSKGKTATRKGMLWAAGVTTVLWGIALLLFIAME